MLEPRSFSWQQCEIKGDVPSGRYAHSGNVVSLRGSKAEILVIMGGYGEAEEISNCYHISLPGFSSEKANEEAAAKLSRIGHSSLVVVDQLYFYGGWNGKKYLSYGGLYSPESSKTLVEKSKQRLLPRARRDHTLTLIGTKMFLFGGWNCKDQFNDLWMLNSAWEWKQIDVDGDIPSPRRGHSACAVGRNLFVFGGTQGFTKFLNQLYIFETKTASWNLVEAEGEPPSPRAWHSATVIGNYMIIFGGTAGRSQVFNDVYALDTTSLTWIKMEVRNAPCPRFAHSACPYGNKIIIFGGAFVNSKRKVECLNDCYLLNTNIPTRNSTK